MAFAGMPKMAADKDNVAATQHTQESQVADSIDPGLADAHPGEAPSPSAVQKVFAVTEVTEKIPASGIDILQLFNIKRVSKMFHNTITNVDSALLTHASLPQRTYAIRQPKQMLGWSLHASLQSNNQRRTLFAWSMVRHLSLRQERAHCVPKLRIYWQMERLDAKARQTQNPTQFAA
ncbi:hypothetical protein LTR95_014277 [Oleoguttula sp. CCFEE 5521]